MEKYPSRLNHCSNSNLDIPIIAVSFDQEYLMHVQLSNLQEYTIDIKQEAQLIPSYKCLLDLDFLKSVQIDGDRLYWGDKYGMVDMHVDQISLEEIGLPSIIGAFNANIVNAASSATAAVCYNGTMTYQGLEATYTITNCVYTNNVFSGILSNGATSVNVTFTAV